ncbi:MAG: tandem-95 repeat protein, partial [Pseudomonadales bacterium]|nr:tandem-95 repeat protein [Pseudomonadales bacterium]
MKLINIFRAKLRSIPATIASLVLLTGFHSNVYADIDVGFNPSVLSLATGESALVEITVDNVDGLGLAAFQLRLNFDSASINILNPNELFRTFGIPPFAPLGGNPFCASVRALASCDDAEWFLTSTGRTAAGQSDNIDNSAGFVDITYGTNVGAAAPTGSGVVALIEVVGVADGSGPIVLSQVIMADPTPVEIPSNLNGITVNVGAGGGSNVDPDALDDNGITNEDAILIIDVLSNDNDTDGDSVSVASVGSASNGVVVNNGTDVSYIPNANFNGVDSFTYSITDGNGGSDTANVSISILPVNDGPSASDDLVNTSEDIAVTVNVLANDFDLDGDTLTVSSVTQGANGSAIISGNDVTYTPNTNFNGADSFTYSVSDGNGGNASATVLVTVGGVNDAPVAIDDAVSTSEEVAVVVNVLANDSDLDGDTLSVSSITQGANGSVTNNGSDVTYTPNANFNGSDGFTYSVSDGNGGSATATVSVSVGGVNDAPEAIDDAASTTEEVAVVVDVLANDSDLDGDSL